jgi:CRP-like cAMP-binding protein
VSYLDPQEHARLVTAMEPVFAVAGDLILTKGSPARSLLLVEDGEVEVVEDAPGLLVLAVIGPGGVVGEVGFVDGQARTLNVRARTNCSLRRLTREQLLALVRDEPTLFAKLTIALAELLAARFRRVVQELVPVRAFAASLSQPADPSWQAERALEVIRGVARQAPQDLAGV